MGNRCHSWLYKFGCDSENIAGIKYSGERKYENDLPKILKPIEYRSLRDACRNDIRDDRLDVFHGIAVDDALLTGNP